MIGSVFCNNTCVQTAGHAHITGKRLGKATLVRVSWPKSAGRDDQIIMCILRSTDRVVLSKVVKALGAHSARLCNGKEVEVCAATKLSVCMQCTLHHSVDLGPRLLAST